MHLQQLKLDMWKSRLQNSPYFLVFKYARVVKQKVWNEAENRERDWGETLKIKWNKIFFFSRLTSPTGLSPLKKCFNCSIGLSLLRFWPEIHNTHSVISNRLNNRIQSKFSRSGTDRHRLPPFYGKPVRLFKINVIKRLSKMEEGNKRWNKANKFGAYFASLELHSESSLRSMAVLVGHAR